MSWTPEKEQKLKELWKKGHTASQIAAMLGDTTRNAVIGKAHRLNLEARATSSRKTKSQLKTQAGVPQKEGKLSRKARYKSLLLDKEFVLLVVSVSSNFAAFFIYVLASPIFLMDHLGFTPQQFGYLFIPTVTGMMFGSLIVKKAAGNIDSKLRKKYDFRIAKANWFGFWS